ncbi:helix-turn-helix transcriptional regulator [Komagataeibacter xylinus]|nr:helix-turn-helix transcriptional regulator [Komagataeibacter xylinus]
MSFRIVLDKFQRVHGLLVEELQAAISETFAQEAMRRGLTQAQMADELDVDESTVSKWLHLRGNPTLKTISKLYAAMDREPFSNVRVPPPPENYVMQAADLSSQGLPPVTGPMVGNGTIEISITNYENYRHGSRAYA